MMVGLLRPTAGEVLIDGHNIATEPQAAKARLAFVPDEPHLFDGLTGREFLEFIGDLYRVPRAIQAARVVQLVDQFDLGEHLDARIAGYSHGTRQKLALVGALLHEPANLLLDEPTVGLDPRAAYVLKSTLRQRAEAGGTVLLSTHILEIAEGLCDRVGILDHGRLLAVGTLEELRARYGDPAASLESLFLTVTAR
jgi:ABC-2 type transport system ATP-binding protein